MVAKNKSPYTEELRDKYNISTENHMQMFRRLLDSGNKGIHNKPGSKKKKG